MRHCTSGAQPGAVSGVSASFDLRSSWFWSWDEDGKANGSALGKKWRKVRVGRALEPGNELASHFREHFVMSA